MNKKYCIEGGGLVGSLLAVILAKHGLNVDVIERRADMRKGKAEAGRSINLALSNRGFKALELAGLTDEVRKLCIPMHGRMVHDVNGETRFMQYGKDGEAINSISRGGLNQMLLEKADESPNVNLIFDDRCEEIFYDKGIMKTTNTQTGTTSEKQYDVFFGTDGAFSAARLSLMRTDMLNFQHKQEYLAHGYKELCIPANEDGSWKIEKNCLHIWPRKSFMMIALPNLDGSFTVTLFLAHKGEVSFENLTTEDSVDDFFHSYFPDVIPLMPEYVHDFFANPTSSLVTIKCSPWHYKDKVTLLGDAAHAIVPFYGQGMNCGFEDCSALDELIIKYGTDWARIFPEFDALRKPNGDAIADLALRNFIEMRDLVADPDFILKNKINNLIGEKFPEKWTTLYRMVTFSDIPYSEALRLGYEHDLVLNKIVKDYPEIESKLNEESIKNLLGNYL